MQISRSYKQHNTIDYYVLPNGKKDVFLHKNETTELDEENNPIYVAEEVYFQTEKSKEEIENNFDSYWENREVVYVEPTDKERLKVLEQAMLEMILGGTI